MYFRYQDAAAVSLERLHRYDPKQTFYYNKHLAKPIPDPHNAGKAGCELSPTDWVKFVVTQQKLYTHSFTMKSIESSLTVSTTVRAGTIMKRILEGDWRPVDDKPPIYENESDNY